MHPTPTHALRPGLAAAIAAALTATIGLTSPADAAIADPLGDAQDTFGIGEPLLDVSQWDLSYDETTMYFQIEFFTEIAAPSLELPNSMAGFIGIDVDQDAATGAAPVQNGFPGFAVLDSGSEFVIDLTLDLFQPGNFALRDAAGFLVATLPVTYTPTTVSGSLPLDLIGSRTGVVDYTGIIGTLLQPTDAMDVVGTSTLVPGPGALALLGLAGVAGRARRRRG